MPIITKIVVKITMFCFTPAFGNILFDSVFCFTVFFDPLFWLLLVGLLLFLSPLSTILLSLILLLLTLLSFIVLSVTVLSMILLKSGTVFSSGLLSSCFLLILAETSDTLISPVPPVATDPPDTTMFVIVTVVESAVTPSLTFNVIFITFPLVFTS